MVDSFADHPPSVTEARAERSWKASAWTPRDALIATLRDLDRGKIEVEALTIIIRDTDGGQTFNTESQDQDTSLLMATRHFATVMRKDAGE